MSSYPPRSGLDALFHAASLSAGAVLGWRGPSAAAVLPALAALAIGLREKPRAPAGRSAFPILRPLLRSSLVVPLLLGLGIAHLHRALDAAPDLLRTWRSHGYEPGATPVRLKARLLDRIDLPDGRIALLLRMERYRLPGPPPFEGSPRGPVRARLTLPSPHGGVEPGWLPGDRLEVTARVEPPRNFRNPGAFDYAAYLRARGIALTGTIKDWRLVDTLPGERDPLMDLLPRVRRSIVGRLRRAAGEGRPASAAFLGALLVGERDDLPQDVEEALVGAGVYHIVALSGLNVVLIASLASFLLSLIPFAPGAKRLGIASSVLLYWLLARDSGSLTRAALMALLYISGGLLERRVSALGSAGVSALLLIAARPAWTGDAGFQLTFGATLGLTLLARGRVTRAFGAESARRALLSRIWMSVRISAAALAGTALVTACHFQTMTPIALVANLFAVPIADLLLLLSVGIVVSEPLLPSLAHALAAAAAGAIDLLVQLSRLVSLPPGCSFHVVPPPAWVVVWGSAAMVLVGASGALTRRVAGVVLAGALIVCAVRGHGVRQNGGLDMVALDVGQGDSIVLRLPDGLTMLVDAGGFARSGFDVGERVVGPALRAMGILRIDILAVTHAHRDHLGGAAAIVKQFSPGAVWLGRMPEEDRAVMDLMRLAAERRIGVVLPRRGAVLLVGGTRIEVLNPGRGVAESGGAANDDSLVLRITDGDRTALLTGDLEVPLESILVSEARNLSADLLKVGHHGSRTSTSAPFLARIAPRLAVISVGSSNPWGHPDAEVLSRLISAGARVYRTDIDGAVRFWTDGSAPWSAQVLVGDRGRERPGQ